MRKQLKKLIPSFLFTLSSKIDLYRIGAHRCDFTRLAPVKRIALNEIFTSAKFRDELKAIEENVRDLAIPDDTGGVNAGDRAAIYCLIRYLMPKTVLEIGTHIGASTLYIALALKKLRAIDPQTSYKLVSVDIRDTNDRVSAPWRRYGAKLSPVEMVRHMECDSVVTFLTSDSLEYFASSHQRYDFIFLDGAHSSAKVYREIPASLRVLGRNGYILLHDYFPGLRPLWADGAMAPGPYLATRRLKKEGAPIEVQPLGELPWRTKLQSTKTSLAVLGKK